jgi:hypothetical protein
MERGHFGEYTGNARCCAGSSPMRMSGAAYDAKEAYNKDLSSKSRMHYLENEIADKKSPAKMYGKKESPAKKAACSKY